MKRYHDLLQKILDEGILQSNRTGTDTLTLHGEMLKFDLREGFPAVTTKKLAWNAVKGELIGFLEGTSSLARFKELGCNVWDANVHSDNWKKYQQDNQLESDYMGRIYGVQWREFLGHEPYDYGRGTPMEVDQIKLALDTVRNNPESRRIIVNAWNPAEVREGMACLPPCHVLFQLLPHVESKVLHMTMYQRSCDMFLGIPFNIASYALLLELFSWWTGYTAGTLTMFLADTHIYVNHIDQVKEQLTREPKTLPKLWIESKAGPSHIQKLPIDVLVASLDTKKLHLLDYDHHPAIKASMAV